MVRLPYDEVKALNTLDVADWLGLEKGRERLKWVCPKCGEDHLNINLVKGMGAKCYTPGCEPEGEAEVWSNIDLTMHAHQVDHQEAVRRLAARFGIDCESASYVRTPRLVAPPEREQQKSSVLHKVWQCQTLGQAGRAYLADRGLSPAVAEGMGIRSVESTEAWAARLSRYTLEERKQAGLWVDPTDYNPDSLHPFRAPFLLLPSFEGEEVEGLRFRGIPPSTATYLSMSGRRAAKPFGCIPEGASTLYVTEGELDAVALCTAGQVAISAHGGGTWQPEWCKAWRGLKRVVVVCDGDEPGRVFGAKVEDAALLHLGILWCSERLTVTQCPAGEDVNDLLRAGVLPLALRYGWDSYEVEERLALSM